MIQECLSRESPASRHAPAPRPRDPGTELRGPRRDPRCSCPCTVPAAIFPAREVRAFFVCNGTVIGNWRGNAERKVSAGHPAEGMDYSRTVMSRFEDGLRIQVRWVHALCAGGISRLPECGDMPDTFGFDWVKRTRGCHAHLIGKVVPGPFFRREQGSGSRRRGVMSRGRKYAPMFTRRLAHWPSHAPGHPQQSTGCEIGNIGSDRLERLCNRQNEQDDQSDRKPVGHAHTIFLDEPNTHALLRAHRAHSPRRVSFSQAANQRAWFTIFAFHGTDCKNDTF